MCRVKAVSKVLDIGYHISRAMSTPFWLRTKHQFRPKAKALGFLRESCKHRYMPVSPWILSHFFALCQVFIGFSAEAFNCWIVLNCLNRGLRGLHRLRGFLDIRYPKPIRDLVVFPENWMALGFSGWTEFDIDVLFFVFIPNWFDEVSYTDRDTSPCFNSKLVRLKEHRQEQPKGLDDLVSIPNWFD